MTLMVFNENVIENRSCLNSKIFSFHGMHTSNPSLSGMYIFTCFDAFKSCVDPITPRLIWENFQFQLWYWLAIRQYYRESSSKLSCLIHNHIDSFRRNNKFSGIASYEPISKYLTSICETSIPQSQKDFESSKQPGVQLGLRGCWKILQECNYSYLLYQIHRHKYILKNLIYDGCLGIWWNPFTRIHCSGSVQKINCINKTERQRFCEISVWRCGCKGHRGGFSIIRK